MSKTETLGCFSTMFIFGFADHEVPETSLFFFLNEQALHLAVKGIQKEI